MQLEMSDFIPDISIEDFMYSLPADRIAAFPADQRDGDRAGCGPGDDDGCEEGGECAAAGGEDDG